MLSLDEPISVSGLSIFRDFNDRSLFYYLPESPQITMAGGEPMFDLLVYRRAAGGEGQLGGGFLTMTTDLKVSQGQRDLATAELSRRFGVDARLSALPVQSGSVRVSLLDATSSEDAKTGGFVERVLAAGTPSLYGDQRAVFTSRLTQDGAVLLDAALRDGGATPVMMVYELTYTGLLPAYECTIKIHFDQTYEYLRRRATFSSLMLQTDVDSEMEELVKNGAIKISDIVYHTEDPDKQAQRRQELLQLAKELATWSFFSPGLTPGKVLATNQRDLFAPPPNFQQLQQRNQQSIQGAMRGNSPAQDGGAQTQGAGDQRQTRPSGNAALTASDPQRPAEDVQPPPGDAAVNAWERAGRPHATLQLKQIEQRERQDIVFELHQVSAATRTISPQGQIRLLASGADLAKQIKVVSLDSEFFKKIDGTVTTSAPLESLGISSMSVQVRHGSESKDIGLDKDHKSDSFHFWADGNDDVIEYQVKLNHIPDAAIGATAADELSPWIKTTSRHLDIDPRELSATMAIQVEAGAVDWALVRQVQATVLYKDGSARIDASKTVKLEQGSPSQTVLVRPGRERTVQVSAKFFYADGGNEEIALERTGSGVVLVNQPPNSTKSVTFILADPLGRYDKVTLQLARPGQDTERLVELKGDLAKANWSFRTAGAANHDYRYQVTYFVGGAVREEAWVTTSADQVVIGDRADGILAVSVLFLADLQSANMKALRLTLRYPKAPSWADPDVQKVFMSRDTSATAAPFLWRVPMAARTETNYEYSLQWIRSDNTTVQVGPVTTGAETLLIDPLKPEAVL